MKLINLTKRTLTLYDTDGTLVEVPPDARHLGMVALGEHRTARDEAGRTFSLNVQTVTEIKGMPEPEDDVLYIVPVELAMVVQQHRDDVAFPAEEAQVRDANGQPRRVTHLRRIVSRIASPV